ncbi:MAG: hypothetical protein ABIR98_11730 [Usitatibacter sp.]
MPLLGKAEKGQLEDPTLEKLIEHYDRHGSGALLQEGLRVVVDSQGVAIDKGEGADPLAATQINRIAPS